MKVGVKSNAISTSHLSLWTAKAAYKTKCPSTRSL